ncbi:MAG: acyl esterase [Pseudomonadota bacterium]
MGVQPLASFSDGWADLPVAVERIDASSLSDMITVQPTFSVATLVTDPAQYNAMLASFLAAGFSAETTEFLAIDNTGAHQLDAYRGLTAALNRARGRYSVLCHQDVRLTHDTSRDLLARLETLTEHDPAWALAGNAGGVGSGKLAMRITDPHGADQALGPFPAQAQSLDENFIVVRGGTRFGFSQDLSGFHLYGADLCLQAEMAGHSAYVIDFHLTHLSAGNADQTFRQSERAFRQKWTRALAPRWLQTTCTLVRIGALPVSRDALRSLAPARVHVALKKRLGPLLGRVERGSRGADHGL